MSDPSDTPFLDTDVLIAWVCEHTAVSAETARSVLDVEHEYMVAVGIVFDPGFVFRYYEPLALDGAPRSVDTDRIARDAERLTGVPFAVGQAVLDAEFTFLQQRGFA